MLDDIADGSIEQGGNNLLVPWVLMGAYAYYQLDRPILSDAYYDRLCRVLTRQWPSIRHRHKWLITRDKNGSAVLLTEADYPSIVISAVTQLIGEHYPHAIRRRKIRKARRRR